MSVPKTRWRPISAPRSSAFVGWPGSLALWSIVMVARIVAVPFVLIYVAVGSIVEALFGIRLRRSDDFDGTGSAG